jgi:hypothetical protein
LKITELIKDDIFLVVYFCFIATIILYTYHVEHLTYNIISNLMCFARSLPSCKYHFLLLMFEIIIYESVYHYYESQRMYLLLIILIAAEIRAQNPCLCTCCLGQGCQPIMLKPIDMQNCTAETCLTQCRCTYSQCLSNYPNGQISTQCTFPLSTCQCQCCRAASPGCTPIFVGYATSYLCQTSSCSIACTTQYPDQCVSNVYGQTQGSCVGPMTTTTTTTTIGPWLGNVCSCSYCQSGSMCPSNVVLGVTSASQCSSSACTQTCQNRYQLTCPTTSNAGQVSGICTSQATGNTKCKCNCCGGNGCINYEININGTGASCYATCQQQSPCLNSYSVTYTYSLNSSKISASFSLSFVILALIITFRFIV